MRDTEPMSENGHHQQMPKTLADLRRRAGLSQTDVAKRMGVNQSRVSQIEATYPDVKHASVLAYITAIGGTIMFVDNSGTFLDAQIAADRERDLTRESMSRSSQKGADILRRSASTATEELPLEQSHAHASGDHTGR